MKYVFLNFVYLQWWKNNKPFLKKQNKYYKKQCLTGKSQIINLKVPIVVRWTIIKVIPYILPKLHGLAFRSFSIWLFVLVLFLINYIFFFCLKFFKIETCNCICAGKWCENSRIHTTQKSPRFQSCKEIIFYWNRLQ